METAGVRSERVPVTIEGAVLPISKVLGGDLVFRMPPYQRPFAWTREHADQLLSDLVGALGTESVDQANPYFLGTMILVKKPESKEADVIDGQQRLTTLTILMSVLRHCAEGKHRDALSIYIHEVAKPFEDVPDCPRLDLRVEDRQFFKEYVQLEGGLDRLTPELELTDSQENIRDCATFLKDAIQLMASPDRERLAKFVIKRCEMVVVSTTDGATAHRLFAVMNSRGLDLNDADILKAEIIGPLRTGVQSDFTERWNDAELRLGREPFNQLFGHLRMILLRRKAQRSILEELRTEMQTRKADSEALLESTIFPLARAFAEIREARYESTKAAPELNALFRRLGRLDNADWLPPAIQCLSRHRNEPEILVPFFRDLERLGAALMIRRARVNERIERHAAVLGALEGQEGVLARVGQALSLSQQECAEVKAALNGDLYMSAACRPVLLRLDESLQEGEATYDVPRISIEHVLPQTPREDSDWVRLFPDPERRARWVHRLANLVLLSGSKNSQARNWDFERKKAEYFTKKAVAGSALTAQVLAESSWSEDQLEARQARLHAKLCDVWRLDEHSRS